MESGNHYHYYSHLHPSDAPYQMSAAGLNMQAGGIPLQALPTNDGIQMAHQYYPNMPMLAPIQWPMSQFTPFPQMNASYDINAQATNQGPFFANGFSQPQVQFNAAPNFPSHFESLPLPVPSTSAIAVAPSAIAAPVPSGNRSAQSPPVMQVQPPSTPDSEATAVDEKANISAPKLQDDVPVTIKVKQELIERTVSPPPLPPRKPSPTLSDEYQPPKSKSNSSTKSKGKGKGRSKAGHAKSKDWRQLSPYYTSILRKYCKDHEIYPTVTSRRAWAELNGLVPHNVHVTIYGIMKGKKKNEVIDDPRQWDLPLEKVLSPEEALGMVVKKEEEEQRATTPFEPPVDTGDEPQDAVSFEPEMESRNDEPVSVDLADDSEPFKLADVNAPSTSAQVIENKNMLHTNNDSLSNANASTSISSSPTPISSNNITSSNAPPPLPFPIPPPFSTDPPTQEDFVDLLETRGFFHLTDGENAITYEDMFDMPIFLAKLKMKESPLDPFFVWRMLKEWYFFF